MSESASPDLLPCPFCGAGTTQIQPNGRIWMGMKWSEPASVSVRHWCAERPGHPSRMIERVGRDEAGAVEAWNTRAAPQKAAEPAAMPALPEQVAQALAVPGCERLREWAQIGPVQRAAVETFADALSAAAHEAGRQQGMAQARGMEQRAMGGSNARLSGQP